MKFKLRPFMRGAVERQVMTTNPNGKGYLAKRMLFLPDQVYEVNDPVVQQFIRGEVGDVREKHYLSPNLMSELELAKIQYEKIRCSSCPSSRPSVLFNPFEIIEE